MPLNSNFYENCNENECVYEYFFHFFYINVGKTTFNFSINFTFPEKWSLQSIWRSFFITKIFSFSSYFYSTVIVVAAWRKNEIVLTKRPVFSFAKYPSYRIYTLYKLKKQIKIDDCFKKLKFLYISVLNKEF